MFVKLLVIASFLYSILSTRNVALLTLLLLAVCNTLLSTILLSYEAGIGLNNKIYIILNTLVWLYLLEKEIEQKKVLHVASLIYILLSIYDLVLVENYIKYDNSVVFVVGAIIYISVFVLESHFQLKKENLNFFKSRNFLLILSPIPFFLGFSFIFGFQIRKLNDTLIIGDIKLFTIICYFVNLIYYSIICLYIYKEQNAKNA